jgi:hypothetical protein
MALLAIIGKKGSKSKLAISKEAGIPLYNGQKIDAIVNYGLAGDKLRRLFAKFPRAKTTPILNKQIGLSKYAAIKEAERSNILVPESKLTLPTGIKLSEWIEKKVHSSQGIGIQRARGRSKMLGKYYQKMISDRRFELRVHAFSWIPQEEWKINKRLGPADQIAWNFHQGGHFASVRYPNKYKVFTEAKDVARKIIDMRRMAFGAVDLIIDNDMRVYFIEVNSTPGFTEFNQAVYFDAMSKLKDLPVRKLSALGS